MVLAVLLAGCVSGQPAGLRGQGVATSAPRHSPPLLPACVVLPSQTMAAGTSMAGHVLVDNSTGHAIHLSGCLSLFQVLLTSRTYRPAVAWAACLQRFTIPVGQTRYRVTVWASYSQCSQARPEHGLRACLPGGRMPPLARGTYHARLFQSSKLVQVPPVITVRVTRPVIADLLLDPES